VESAHDDGAGVESARVDPATLHRQRKEPGKIMQTGKILSIGFTFAAAALAAPGARANGHSLTGVPAANPKTAGRAVPSVLSPELRQSAVAQGANALENPNAYFTNYGYNADGPMLPAPGDIQAPGHNVEATKTEPDKNTYLVLDCQHGADASYEYGHEFLYQGHELGMPDPVTGNGVGCITRINLEADGAHRVTLMATQDSQGNSLPEFDGSSWDPWANRLLFTAEGANGGGMWQATLDYPSTVVPLIGILGQGGFEGVQNDDEGNVWIVEDSGGAKGTVNSHAKQPNSFIFRFLPNDRHDLTLGGRMQALQVMSHSNPGQAIIFHAGQADADILSQDVADLHTYGITFTTNWVTIHDTNVDGFAPFNANALAKTLLATPFKRPENGQFRPGSQFTQFIFDETGDTDQNSEAGSQYGGYGSLMKWTRTSNNHGTLKLLFQCDIDRCSLDNCAFWDATHVVFVEDRGDGLHSQHNALDSAFLFDVNANYGNPSTPAPIRILAEGRDTSATIDSALSGIGGNGFQNEGDNELTGFHISDGDPSHQGILGARVPHPFTHGWRVFYTQQHGDNMTWEILPAGSGDDH
jgi:hypothetical protein